MSPELLLSGALLVTVLIAVLQRLPSDRRDENNETPTAQPQGGKRRAQVQAAHEIQLPEGMIEEASLAMDIGMEARAFHSGAIAPLSMTQLSSSRARSVQALVLLGFIKELGQRREAPDFACSVAFEAATDELGLSSDKAQLMAQQYPRLWEQDSSRILLAMGRTMAGIWAGGERERAQMVFSSLLRDHLGS
jgi:hypothetical protein